MNVGRRLSNFFNQMPGLSDASVLIALTSSELQVLVTVMKGDKMQKT